MNIYWWHDKKNNSHYFGSNLCLEIMIESSVSMSQCVKIDFVNHHEKICSVNRMSPEICKEIGMSGSKAAGKFLAAAIGSGLDLKEYKELFKKGFEQCYAELILLGDDADFNGTLRSSDTSSEATVISFANLIAIHKNDEHC